jgi:hypothetical protein
MIFILNNIHTSHLDLFVSINNIIALVLKQKTTELINVFDDHFGRMQSNNKLLKISTYLIIKFEIDMIVYSELTR